MNLRPRPSRPSDGSPGLPTANWVLIVMLMAGLVLLAQGGSQLHWAMASIHWPTAPGVILDSHVQAASGPAAPVYPTDAPSYVATVTYRYYVAGRPYVGHRRQFGEPSLGSRHSAQQIASRYPPGSRVIVHYDPAHVERCVLEAGVSWSQLLPLAIGLLLTTTGGVGVLRLFRTDRAFRLRAVRQVH
ncbi:MAG: DUF3592 domain-containing protein [Limnochordaceae bacterium]|nr:DUF3592 domain-containing protein [Limnochordaceae bacterium]